MNSDYQHALDSIRIGLEQITEICHKYARNNATIEVATSELNRLTAEIARRTEAGIPLESLPIDQAIEAALLRGALANEKILTADYNLWVNLVQGAVDKLNIAYPSLNLSVRFPELEHFILTKDAGDYIPVTGVL